MQLSFSLLLSLIYTAVSENIGNHVLINFLTGKYHKPIEEERIFMFLDMKHSTYIAEKLGNTQYFEFLKLYYQTMSDPIIYSKGEVYQYIGDEVVVSWKVEDYTNNLNCIVCFFEIRKSIEQHQKLFQEKFRVVPEFKAGMHVGSVTIGEVGALKKEITYSGDVLNTTSRVQELCKKYHHSLIITDDVKNILALQNEYNLEKLDEVDLRGKTEIIRLFAVQKK